MVNLGNQGAQSFRPVRADIVATDTNDGMVHLQAQYRIHEGSGGGSLLMKPTTLLTIAPWRARRARAGAAARAPRRRRHGFPQHLRSAERRASSSTRRGRCARSFSPTSTGATAAPASPSVWFNRPSNSSDVDAPRGVHRHDHQPEQLGEQRHRHRHDDGELRAHLPDLLRPRRTTAQSKSRLPGRARTTCATTTTSTARSRAAT